MAVRKPVKKQKSIEHILYGDKNLPIDIKTGEIVVQADTHNGLLHYTRTCRGKQFDSRLAMADSSVKIHPVEPLHVPKLLTHLLMIAFETPILLEPYHSTEIFVTFPVEIAVLVTYKDNEEVLDVFSVSPSKYSLYGNPHDGHICKYWLSTVSTEKPDCDISSEGIMHLNLRNETNQWVNVSKSIFNGYGMKIYFNESIIMMKATMRITGKNIAETDFEDMPSEQGLQRSTELFAVKRLSMVSRKFVMEGDL
ncbi:MAG: DUF432 domain-containing protein [bacterium]